MDKSYILLSKFNHMLSFVLVVKCWDNTSVSFITVGKSVSIFVLWQTVIFLFPEKILFSWDNFHVPSQQRAVLKFLSRLVSQMLFLIF